LIFEKFLFHFAKIKKIKVGRWKFLKNFEIYVSAKAKYDFKNKKSESVFRLFNL